MANVTFDFVPDWTEETTIKPRVTKCQFSDGYVQRETVGINLFPQVHAMKFTCSDEDADAIEALLQQAAGGTILWKVPPDEDSDPYLKWILSDDGYKRAKNDYNNNVITCTFQQVFE